MPQLLASGESRAREPRARELAGPLPSLYMLSDIGNTTGYHLFFSFLIWRYEIRGMWLELERVTYVTYALDSQPQPPHSAIVFALTCPCVLLLAPRCCALRLEELARAAACACCLLRVARACAQHDTA
jgi:hypothetical protein